MSHVRVRPEDPSVETFRGVFFKMRRALGTTVCGINEIRLPAGAEGLEHDERETGHEEIYVVLAGGGHFTVDGERVDVSAGDYLRVGADATRTAVAGPDGLRFVAVGGRPLDAFDGRESL